MSVETFAQELRCLGYEVTESHPFVIFGYEIDAGPRTGQTVSIGLEVSGHPDTPPTGPFVSPRLLPLRPDGSPAPWGGVHEAHGRNGFNDPQGVWQYWSRPYAEWLQHGRSAEAYLTVHLRRLMAHLPSENVACAA
jgi:hypothetical protein